MKLQINSLRTFIGAKDFDISRSFYKTIGFEEKILSPGFSLFYVGEFCFYLQAHYVEDWINNLMLFIEVNDVESCYEELKNLQLHKKYPGVKLVPVKKNDWGEECFLHDPAGVLLHFGRFYNK